MGRWMGQTKVFLIWSYTCSIGFRSGLTAGQGRKTFTPFWFKKFWVRIARCAGALSFGMLGYHCRLGTGAGAALAPLLVVQSRHGLNLKCVLFTWMLDCFSERDTLLHAFKPQHRKKVQSIPRYTYCTCNWCLTRKPCCACRLAEKNKLSQ